MDQNEQIDHLANELVAVINRFRAEYDLTLAAAIGTLEVVKLELFTQET
jgi:uncharacterized protein YejL (UPF0352 family)